MPAELAERPVKKAADFLRLAREVAQYQAREEKQNVNDLVNDPNPRPAGPAGATTGAAAIARAGELAEKVLAAMEQNVLGQPAACELLLATYIAGGHALLEGVPGIGKTLLARVFSAALGLDLQRIQFTPDLMPTDVVGTNVFDPSTGKFRLAARADLQPRS